MLETDRERERESLWWHTVAWYTKLTDFHGNTLLSQDFLFLLVVCPKKMSPANRSGTNHLHIIELFKIVYKNALKR